MKLYDEYNEVIKKIGKIKKAYFTTFNIDIVFVEKYILPPLLDEDIADNKVSLENLNVPLIEKNPPDIKFFYNANMLSSFDKKTLVEIHPIMIKGGVFHPKVIYLKGDKATYLFVGSGNLTISGWGRNIEAFKIIDITNETNLENQVLDFFDDVLELTKLPRVRKTSRNPSYNNDVDFIYSFGKKENSILLKSLNIDRTLQIYSPYFSDDLDGLFEKEEFKNIDKIDIVPDLIENLKVRLEQLPKDNRVKFYRFKKEDVSKKNANSTNHSKIWISDTKYAIGSHNCSEAALYGKNFEASIVKNYNNKDDFSLDGLKPISDIEISKNSDDEERILEEENDRFKVLYSLTADYKNYDLKPNLIDDIDKKAKYILLPSFSDSIKLNKVEKLPYERKVKVFRALVKNKLFEILDEKGSVLYKGFILEENAKLSNRMSNSIETLDEMFLALADLKYPTEAKFLENRTVDIFKVDEALYKRKNKRINVNYFSMFIGFKNLNDTYEKIKNDETKLERFCFTSASSLSAIKNIIEKKLINEDLFIFLMVKEFNKLIGKRKIKNISKIEEPKITFSAKDKKFIEAMK